MFDDGVALFGNEIRGDGGHPPAKPVTANAAQGVERALVRIGDLRQGRDLALKRLLMEESKSVEVTERYILDKFALMTLTAGVMSINSNPVPYKIHDKDGKFDDDQFWLKFGWMLKRGIHVLASIGANHTWFEMRVRKLLVAVRVKNG